MIGRPWSKLKNWVALGIRTPKSLHRGGANGMQSKWNLLKSSRISGFLKFKIQPFKFFYTRISKQTEFYAQITKYIDGWIGNFRVPEIPMDSSRFELDAITWIADATSVFRQIPPFLFSFPSSLIFLIFLRWNLPFYLF